MKNGLTGLLLLAAVVVLLGGGTQAQDRGKFQKENYSMDANQQLLIEVHVWGEVNKPGVFQVPDGSTVLDVISAAGGPTQYAALSRVRLSHTPEHRPRIEPVNLDRYLSNEKAALPQVLKPGDAVMVPRNTRFFWKDAVSLIADIAVIVNVYYLISRNR